MKQASDEQEVIILGSGLGGLVAGALLSINNRPVVLIKEDGYQSSYSIKGYRFVPFSNFSEKCLKPSLLKKISQALNLPSLVDTQGESKQAKGISETSRQKVAFQVVLPKARIDIFSQHPLYQEEWKREFPKEVVLIEAFYNEVDQICHLQQKAKAKENASPFFPFPPHSVINTFFSFGPFSKKKLGQRLSLFSKEFKEFIQLQLISWGNLCPDRIPLSLASRILFDETHEGNSNVDLERLGTEILNQFLRSGGRIEEVKGVKKVEMGWKKRFTLLLEGERKEFRSNFLIYNGPLHRLSNLMGKKREKLSKWEKRIKPSYVMVPIFLGVREKVIPVGMKDLLVSIFDLEKPYDDGNILFLSLSPKGDETKAPAGRRALTVESLMDLEKWDQTLLVDYQKGVMNHLMHLFPFLEDYTELVDFQWASEHVPKWSYPHFFYETPTDFHWGEGVVPTRLSNSFYFIGKENFPYLGLEGEISSGWMVAQRILKRVS